MATPATPARPRTTTPATIPPATAPAPTAATGADRAIGAGEMAGISEGMVELVMFTATTLVAFVPTGCTGVIIVYDAEPVVAGKDTSVVDRVDVPVGVKASVVDGDNAPVVVGVEPPVVDGNEAPVVV